MATVRQRRRSKNSLQKVRQPVRPVREASIVKDATLRGHWAQGKTVETNFRTVGLANKLNKDLNKRETRRRLADWNRRRLDRAAEGGDAGFDSEDEIFADMEQILTGGTGGGEVKEAARQLEAAAVAAHQRKQELHPEGVRRPLTEDESEYIRGLVQKHGQGNYEAMSRDLPANYNQLTARQLEKLANRL